MKETRKERIQKAQNRALESLDYILETIPTSDYVEIVGRMGGDAVTYRIYDEHSVDKENFLSRFI